MSHKEEKLQIVKEKALSKKGTCLSESYINTSAKLKFRCQHDHEWSASYYSVVDRGTWCRTCAMKQTNANNRNNKYSQKKSNEEYLIQAHAIASKKNGKCLTTNFEKLGEKLEWKCHVDRHAPWKAILNNVKHNGTWCPQCNLEKGNLTENKVRLILETYFNFKLNPARPSWNKNPLTKYPLELDGYNEEYKIAFEHDGEHHLQAGRFSPENTKLELVKQKYKDFMKKKNCSDRGITLINIPIPRFHDRKHFFIVLRHVINHCKPHGTILTFDRQQLRQMKSKFDVI